ncbi:MAG: DUF411 domain-containing protein, partial [Gemmatimonadota bacterium]|nr:DUF411 domain-containing protein [Gemmatimonadota bacterium]
MHTNTGRSHHQHGASRRWFIGAAGVGLAAVAVPLLFRGRERAAVRSALATAGDDAEMVVYKSPTCECCGKWIEHVRNAGFPVRVVEQADVTPVKERLHVPTSVYSCHTATVGDYVVEGHVPATDIARLLKERSPVAGVAAPGMPARAPGMDLSGPSYDVVAFGHD